MGEIKILTPGRQIIRYNEIKVGADGDTSKDEMKQFGQDLAKQGVAALSQRIVQGKQGIKGDVQAACGRKPLLKSKQGAYQKCVNKFMKGQGGSFTSSAPAPEFSSMPMPEEKKGMSTGAKVGIAIGAVALLGVIIYFVKKKK